MKDTHADRVWRADVKTRDGWQCRWPECRRRTELEVHHVFSRGYGATKTEMDNGVTLCPDHHTWAQQHTTEFNEWWASQIGLERFQQLRTKALSLNGKLVPRPEAQEPPSVHQLLASPGVPDPQKPVDLAMALLTVEMKSATANVLCREIDHLHRDELKSMIMVLVGAARGAIATHPKPDQFRAGLALNLQREARS